MEPIKYVRAWDELSPREQAEFAEAIEMHRACDADLGFPFALRDEWHSEMGKCLCVWYFDSDGQKTCCYHYNYREDAKGWPDSWPDADGWDGWHWWQQD